jgi:hypothetical protein
MPDVFIADNTVVDIGRPVKKFKADDGSAVAADGTSPQDTIVLDDDEEVEEDLYDVSDKGDDQEDEIEDEEDDVVDEQEDEADDDEDDDGVNGTSHDTDLGIRDEALDDPDSDSD